jgi:hypothetical protein
MDDRARLDRIARLTARIARIDHLRLLCWTDNSAVDERLRDHLQWKREAVTAELARLRQQLSDSADE